MKNFFTAALIASLAIGAQAQVSTDAQLEQLGRGVIALPAQSGGIFVSWRFLGTDSESTTFDLLRDGNVVKADISTATCHTDATVEGALTINDPTDIKSIETITTGTIIHDLFGRRVHNPSNGIYIVNGRKVHIQ